MERFKEMLDVEVEADRLWSEEHFPGSKFDNLLPI